MVAGSGVDVTPPFVVSTPPECEFYRSAETALSSATGGDGDVFDAHGLRLSSAAGEVSVRSVEPDELAHLLRRWLGHADVLRESTASWPLWLLVHAAVEHRGYGD
ncbi:hypothetical protein [Mycolicibacterium sediminis]|uniref:Uncharacterized protein n=1 Tax=Mycolicibacterium sediminis TaxID=1286180 RepID=A0A7I7QZD2_9MYCO|nr:hypothetical protein [Mycolicibacterium sediminis]BBY31256.1 hypothetical protein MSEDJ_53520 [Mycolicibacterium sediminis]